ncbi:MAG: methionine gamma-lyase family protein [Oscillospiraceae bacterium]|nr:methionine gamma-lyase family protein [Oscillospiraceae bacterium]
MLNNNFFDIDPKLMEVAREAENACSLSLAGCETIAEYNGAKVLSAFIKNKVSESCFCGSTGYGYGDIGRDVLDKVYADVFGAEDALVRHNFVSGTHALSVALFGVLRPGDKIVSVTGKPYDTLEEVIGIRSSKGNGSLVDFGVKYDQVDLLEGGEPDMDSILKAVQGAKVAYIQRSRGYSLRRALTAADIEKIACGIKVVSPDTIVMVDNCYGEFVEKLEPTQVGADLIAGSLIKNAGGAVASTGGYIAGRRDLVELCSYRLTCVGMGKEVGCSLNQNREMFLGLFMAPDIVSNAVKTATFASELFTRLGFQCYPKKNEQRGDIVTVLRLGSEELLTAFCQGIQKGAPVDSFVVPEAWDMPGYDSKVIMAAGTFTLGSSIELSADAPIREPYAAWMQGGITYTSGKIGILLAAQEMLSRNLITL